MGLVTENIRTQFLPPNFPASRLFDSDCQGRAGGSDASQDGPAVLAGNPHHLRQIRNGFDTGRKVHAGRGGAGGGG